MILWQSKPHGVEHLDRLIEKSSLGEALVEQENGKRRWIPPDWIVEED